jgi:hypothetical protein
LASYNANEIGVKGFPTQATASPKAAIESRLKQSSESSLIRRRIAFGSMNNFGSIHEHAEQQLAYL